jgi:aspartyl-tRNA(Asn)/glutamyl-tRNA(Gln) amidotransferase subunit A
LFNKKVDEVAKKNKWKLKNINLPLEIALETYYIIVYTEFFSTTRKFDGRRFGKKIEDFAGPEVVRRIIGGSEITKAEFEGKYYKEALKARNYIKEEFTKLFNQVDAILLPTTPKTPHKIGDQISVEDMYAYDIFTTLSSITGIPTISIPMGKVDEKDVGLQILAPHFEEDLIFKLAKKFE